VKWLSAGGAGGEKGPRLWYEIKKNFNTKNNFAKFFSQNMASFCIFCLIHLYKEKQYFSNKFAKYAF